MKKFMFLLLVLIIGTPVFAEPIIKKNYNLASTAAPEVVNLNGTGINFHNIRWNNPGTATTCTVEVEKSNNGSTGWTDLIAPTSCTSSGSASITSGVANFIRVKLATYGGSGVVSVWYGGYIDIAAGISGGTGTSGQVAFFDSASTIAGDSDLTFHSSSNTLLTPNLMLGTPIASLLGSGDEIQCFSNSSCGMVLSTALDGNNWSEIGLRRARGSQTGLSDVADTDSLGWLIWRAYAGSYFPTAAIKAYVDGTVTTAQRPPSKISFITNAANSAQTERFEIRASGNFLPSTDNTYAFGDATHRLTNLFSAATTFNTIGTTTPCLDAAGAAACGAAVAGSVVIDAAATSVVVSTTAVTANSQIFIQEDSGLGTRLSVTCNATPQLNTVSARTAATSFTISTAVAPVTNPRCYSYVIIN